MGQRGWIGLLDVRCSNWEIEVDLFFVRLRAQGVVFRFDLLLVQIRGVFRVEVDAEARHRLRLTLCFGLL